jgi:hypothetical protein
MLAFKGRRVDDPGAVAALPNTLWAAPIIVR